MNFKAVRQSYISKKKKLMAEIFLYTVHICCIRCIGFYNVCKEVTKVYQWRQDTFHMGWKHRKGKLLQAPLMGMYGWTMKGYNVQSLRLICLRSNVRESSAASGEHLTFSASELCCCLIPRYFVHCINPFTSEERHVFFVSTGKYLYYPLFLKCPL